MIGCGPIQVVSLLSVVKLRFVILCSSYSRISRVQRVRVVIVEVGEEGTTLLIF